MTYKALENSSKEDKLLNSIYKKDGAILISILTTYHDYFSI